MNEIIEDDEVFFNDVPDEDLNKELQKSMDDIKAGRVISFSDFKEKLNIISNLNFLKIFKENQLYESSPD